MKTLRKLSSTIALGLVMCLLMLGVTPTFAQQPAQAQQHSQQQTALKEAPLMALAEGEPVLLTDEQMKAVDGGIAPAVIVGTGLAVLGIALATAAIWQANHAAHGHPSEVHLHWRERGWWKFKWTEPVVEFHHNVRRR